MKNVFVGMNLDDMKKAWNDMQQNYRDAKNQEFEREKEELADFVDSLDFNNLRWRWKKDILPFVSIRYFANENYSKDYYAALEKIKQGFETIDTIKCDHATLVNNETPASRFFYTTARRMRKWKKKKANGMK